MFTVVYKSKYFTWLLPQKLTGVNMNTNEFLLKDISEVGNFIKSQRKEMNITQEELANFAGLSRVGVVKFEKDEGDIKFSTLLKVVKFLGFEIVLRKRANK